MRKILFLLALGLFTCSASGGERPPDITGANKRILDAHLGTVVSLRGKLDVGVHGEILAGATKGVPFYIIAELPPGGFNLPESWTRLLRRQVRVTGTLGFRSFPRPPDGKYEGAWSQPPPDYYYMVLQRTQIQPVETK